MSEWQAFQKQTNKHLHYIDGCCGLKQSDQYNVLLTDYSYSISDKKKHFFLAED